MPAALFNLRPGGEVECLFQGIIQRATQLAEGGCRHFTVEVASSSSLLDIQTGSQSFQRTTDTYHGIAQTVAGNATIGNFLPDTPTGKLMIRYQETPWEFAKRMCSHLNSGLVPDIYSEFLLVGFGVPGSGTPKAITGCSYTIVKDLRDYQTTAANWLNHSQPAVTPADFTYYQVESYDRYSIGDSVTFLNHTLYIKAFRAVLAGSTLIYTYDLVSKQGLVQPDIHHDKLAGVSLTGEVKVITKDQVKVHLHEIDQQWDEGGDWYFPYSTIFSSPGGSGWYVMPEPGDTVKITVPNTKAEDAVASSSVNRVSQAPEQRSNPDNKSMSNKYGKQVLFTPEGIYIINQAGRMFINLTDADGVTLASDKNISLEAKESILIQAGQDIVITAENNLQLDCGSALIQSDNSGLIKIQGTEVRTN